MIISTPRCGKQLPERQSIDNDLWCEPVHLREGQRHADRGLSHAVQRTQLATHVHELRCAVTVEKPLAVRRGLQH
jgi:hypothetical protein